MKNVRAVVTRAGGPELLALVEEPAPEPGPGEARLRIRAVGIAFADVYSRLGMRPTMGRTGVLLVAGMAALVRPSGAVGSEQRRAGLG